MKVLIGTVDVCGWISVLSEELKKQGHDVITISEPNRFNPEYKFDIEPQSYTVDFLNYLKKVKPLTAFAFVALSNLPLIGDKFKNYIYNYSRVFFSKHCDLFIYLWNGIATDESDLALFKKEGKKIITWFVGDDVRYYPAMKEHFGIKSNFYEGYFKKTFQGLIKKLRIHEKYADLIYSVPDQASLALRPYYHLQIPVQANRFNFNITGNKVPVVLHIPSSPQIKGTDIIRKTIKDLQDEGVEFIYKELINIPNSEVLRELSNADVLVDELFLHGPGVLSFEAMGSGCAVATRYIVDSPKSFSPPVVAIDEDNIKDKVRSLITDSSLRSSLMQKGRDYIIKNNAAPHIVSAMMNNLEKAGTPDYFPVYLREQFKPPADLTECINAQTDFVKNEIWYKEYVKPGERKGLKF